VSSADASRRATNAPRRSGPASSAWLEVRRPGPLATVQDLGRPGLAHLGVPPAGAVDAVALRLANALVGNAPGAAGIEATLAGPELVLSHDRAVAVTGAAGGWAVDGVEVPLAATVVVPAGAVVAVGPTRRGVRSYVAVEGGVSVPPVLGSSSSDTLSGLGPAPLSPGTRLLLGPACEPWPWLGATGGRGPVVARVLRPELEALALGEKADGDAWPVLRGPHLDRLGEEAFRALCATTWVVSSASDRAGLRLEAADGVAKRAGASGAGRADRVPGERSMAPALDPNRLPRRRGTPARAGSGGWVDLGQVPPLGMVTGAVQLPRAGLPIVLLANHATTGGYPVVAVVARAALGRAGQARPRSIVRFRPTTVDEARELLRRLEEQLSAVGA